MALAGRTGTRTGTGTTMSKAQDRTLSLATAMVMLISIGGSAISMINAFVHNASLKLAFNITILGIVFIDFTLFIVVLCMRAKRVSGDNESVYWKACLTMLMPVINFFVIPLSIFAFKGLGLYIVLCVVLLTNTVVIGIVHWKR